MDITVLRSNLDNLLTHTESSDIVKIPKKLRDQIDRWQWGKYGWTSPSNLIVTASWWKVYYPEADCCKIWAKDSSNNPIEGGYSMRSADEGVTVPLFSKHDLCVGFCSNNSGMQGSRALEKSRGLGRIDRSISLDQRTVFDASLFANILNDINELQPDEALETLKHLIVIAKQRKSIRDRVHRELVRKSVEIDLISFAEKAGDPELVKCMAGACLDLIFGTHGLVLDGVSDHKTASDGQASKPGDLTLYKENMPIIAIEVKDRSRGLDWQNLENATKIVRQWPTIQVFMFVLESRNSVMNADLFQIAQAAVATFGQSPKFSFISLADLIAIAVAATSYSEIVVKTAQLMTLAPSIKPETKQLWVQQNSVIPMSGDLRS